jgi:hypothetical protein
MAWPITSLTSSGTTDAKLVDTLQAVAARLGIPARSPPLFSPPTRPQQVQSPIRGGNNQQPSQSPADAARCHGMVPKHHWIQSLYDKWYGLGNCLDKPAVGRIAAIKIRFKSKWRNHFSASEKKTLRSQMVIRAILRTDRWDTQHCHPVV